MEGWSSGALERWISRFLDFWIKWTSINDKMDRQEYNKHELKGMNIKVKISIWVVCIGILCMPLHAEQSTLDSLLTVYAAEVAQTNDYLAVRQARIDSLYRITPRTPDLTLAIAREYQSYQSDSARIYYGRLLEEAEPYRTHAIVGLVELHAATGRFEDGIATMQLMDSILPSFRLRWYEAVRRLYSDGALWSTVPSLQEKWQQEADRYQSMLMNAWREKVDEEQEMDLLLAQYTAMEKGDLPTALTYNEQLLAKIDPTAHEYAIKAYERAILYEQSGNETKRREWLVRSAIQDVRCAVTDNGSSWLVAKDCYEDGDLSRAYLFSNYSLTNASFFNAPTRFNQTFTLGHTIATDYEQRLNDLSIRLGFALICLVLLLVAVVLITIYTLRNNKRLHILNKEITAINEEFEITNRQLKEANMVKEQYICRYLEVYSDYIRRLVAMARKAGEKDPDGIKSREMAHFYRSFDDTFLSIYVTFVQDFNALLKPEAQLIPKKGERMTVEMRIFALILLGIDNSAKIGELLCYSPNTISNYRVRVKNGALGDRETFDDRVRAIGALY